MILTVTNETDAQARLLRSRELGIGSTQFKLTDSIGIENFSKDRLLEHLRAVSFHNLTKVAHLFQVGLQINIMPQGEELQRIQDAVRMRHDCVHRNGKTKDGEERLLNESDIRALLSEADKLVKWIEAGVKEEAESPF